MSIRRSLIAVLFGVVGLTLAAPATSFAAQSGETAVRSTHQGKKGARKKAKKVEKADKKADKKDKKKDPGFEM